MAVPTMTPQQLAQIPWIMAPPGEVSDFNTTDTTAPIFAGVTISTLVLASMALCCRFYVKCFVHKKFWLDDVCLLIGFAFDCAFVGLVINDLAPLGAGRHIWDVRRVDVPGFAKKSTDLAILSEPQQMFVSLGFLFFYLELFRVNRAIRWLSLGSIVAVSIVYIVPLVLYAVFRHASVSHTDADVNSGTNVTVGTLNVVTNIMILVIPISAVSSLQLSRPKKFGVVAIFATGSLCLVMSIMGLVYRVRAIHSTDITREVIPRWIVTTVEVNVGIICACLPLMPALFHQKALRQRRTGSKPSDGSLVKNSGILHSHSNAYAELDDANSNVELVRTEAKHGDRQIVVRSDVTVDSVTRDGQTNVYV